MNKVKSVFFTICFSLSAIFIASFSVSAQQPKTEIATPKFAAQNSSANVQDFQLTSKLMARQMPYRVILPASYEISKTKTAVEKPLSYPVLYLLHGLTGHFDNWGSKTKLADYAKNFNYIIVMPEGNNGWYSDSATVANDKYESYIVQELIPEIERKFRVKPARESRAIAGLSMGGYGAIKFGLKYPQMFALVGSFSGALGAASWTEKEIGTKGTIAESINGVFGLSDNANRSANNIFKMALEASDDQIKSMPFVYQSCGTEDFLYKNNRDFVDVLQQKKIPHEYRETPGGHDWKFWNAQVKEFLNLSESFLK